ncbi:dihydrofolate reductase [Corynebacterium sp. 3HC-13]|uniref:dihydrofolate reductase n=1 Tax=Corynebacterium poyangense TaxID=2684405 RepID=UPI001CCEB7BA|nr:dihydrofolate reductase [Corynebacterium poyangense]MBZ8176322.1 dihydrofolate reductase [Corynebacterium poyangense]
MGLSAIWAQSHDRIIGDGSTMPWYLPEDLAHFKELTQGYPVVMGRHTWESLPARFRPLPGRQNLILSSQAPGSWSSGAEIISSAELSDLDQGWVIGGGMVYQQLLPYCDRIEITLIDLNLDDFLPHPTLAPHIPQEFHLKTDSGWQESAKGALTLPRLQPDAHLPLRYRFQSFYRSHPRT